ncbi:MAG: DNA mismatch endonuclease Vsr [Planctomycetaceae bacterium]
MVDCFDKAARRRVMAAVRQKDTQPELVVRRLAHALGYRFRLHAALPGRPDVVFPGRRKVILVHGCFWHRHDCRRGRATPVTNAGFWAAKFQATVRRDRKTMAQLRRLGWSVMVVWECQTATSGSVRLARRIESFLGPPGSGRNAGG